MIRQVVMLTAALWLGGCLMGCMTEGERTLDIELFGQKISIHDRAHTNDQGEQKYRTGFIAEDAFVKRFLPPAEEGPPAPVGAGTD